MPIIAIFFVAGCAFSTDSREPLAANYHHWQGRLSVKIQVEPVQLFSANFDLQGSAEAGTLSLSSTWGNTLARLQWDPLGATLHTSGAPRHFDSLDALTRHLTGTDLPLANLFSWLAGEELPAIGWQADLQEVAAGRIRAHRESPGPSADLTILLER
jgi:outer membrane lipoprotein LolB